MSQRIEDLLGKLTLDEKVDLVTGRDMWHTRPVAAHSVGSMKVTDGPNGARGDGLMGTGTPTACIPCGSVLGATWDPELLERLGVLLGDECGAKGAHVLLAPTINLHRSPKGGRNFECYSEDPVLTGRLAAAFVRGVQSRGVATTAKHFVANDSEFERNTIDSQVDERTLREVYLLPFEYVVKDASAWGLMSAYNRLNGTYCSENEWLLDTVLRQEWGFDGFVVSDWFALRATEASARAGLSLEMPGQGQWYGPKLKAAVESGALAESAVDRIALDVLRVLERTGALEPGASFEEATLDRPEDRALAREAAVAGTVLLRNDGLLPLDVSGIQSIAVLGPNAYVAKVMGGGSAKVNSYRATSPLDALSARLGNDVVVRYEKGCAIDRSTPPLTKPHVAGPVSIEYFDGDSLEGPVVAARERGDFDLMAFGQPVTELSGKSYSMRVSAELAAVASGPHSLRMTQAGRARVLVDGEVVIDATEGDFGRGSDFFGFGSAEISEEIELEAGIAHELTVEFCNRDAVLLSGFRLGLESLVDEDLLGRAERLAAESDVAIVVVGTNDDWETEGRDRDLFELPGDQPELIRRVAARNPRTIVVLNVGAPHQLDWLDEPAAVLSVGFGGQELGDALVDVLLGHAEPGGRMPTTVPARYEHFAAYVNYPGENSIVRYGEGVFVGHRWHDAVGIEPAVPFGFGLSYTTFEIGVPTAPVEAGTGDVVTVTVDVANTGERAGSEVVQIYVEPDSPRIRRPVRELKAFRKVTLPPGETTTLSIDLEPRAFAYFDPADSSWEERRSAGPVPAGSGGLHRSVPGWYVDAGSYRIVVGRSSRDFAGSAAVSLTGESARLAI
jgi:beta-glucosidase